MRLRDLTDGGDKEIRDVYSRYRDPFVSWIRRKYDLEAGDAKEVFQHAVVIMYDNLKGGKVNSLDTKIKTYVYGIGLNLARQHIRAEARKTGDPSPILLNQAVDNSGIRAKEALEANIVRMFKALDKLGDPCKSLLQFFYIDNMSMENICYLLGYNNADTAKSRKYKCLQRLKAIFSEQASADLTSVS